VRAALELLEEHEVQLEARCGALIEDEQSGPSAPVDLDGFIEARRSADTETFYILLPRAQADLGEIWDHTLNSFRASRRARS
jgi:hypothetical protein